MATDSSVLSALDTLAAMTGALTTSVDTMKETLSEARPTGRASRKRLADDAAGATRDLDTASGDAGNTTAASGRPPGESYTCPTAYATIRYVL
jgi:hypothetical protein